MANTKQSLRICSRGHQYYKSSDCPTCPICEQERKPKEGFLTVLPAPARRVLERKGITTLKQLSIYTEQEILSLHGMGLLLFQNYVRCWKPGIWDFGRNNRQSDLIRIFLPEIKCL